MRDMRWQLVLLGSVLSVFVDRLRGASFDRGAIVLCASFEVSLPGA